MTNWNQIYSAGNSLEAHSLKGMLENQGIAVMLKGEALASATGELPADVLAVTLWVEDFRINAAKQLLEQYEAQQTGSWFCGGCGESNGGNFEICWQCQKDKPEG